MTTKKQLYFWLFTLIYWALAASALFFERYSVANGHLQVSLVRHFYIFLIGASVSAIALPIVKHLLSKSPPSAFVYGLLYCLLAALLVALVLNPVTYMMVGYDLHSLSLQTYLTGFLYFFLLFLLWLSLYAQFFNEPLKTASYALPAQSPDSTPINNQPCYFDVEKLGERRQLCSDDIVLIYAQGDYVELVTTATSYVVKYTMAAILSALPELQFWRIHRSCIINRQHLLSVKPQAHGVCLLELSGGHQTHSSRSYKSRVEQLLPIAS